MSHSLTVIFFARTLFRPSDDGSDFTDAGWEDGQYSPSNASAYGSNTSTCSEDKEDKDDSSVFTDGAGEDSFPNVRADGLRYKDHFKVVIENITESDKTKVVQKLRQEFWGFPSLLGWKVGKAVPSDSVNGNMLEAINTSLNMLDKHHMDRDLVRTGNSIVMISASTAFFKVSPWVAQVSLEEFKRIFLYTSGILFHLEWCIGQL